MSDETLIQEFIGGILRGDGVLLSNSNLRIEPVLYSLQLLSQKDGLIASVNIKNIPTIIEAREETEYWPLVHQNLLDEKYLPFSSQPRPKTYRYKFCDVPKGYTVCCSTAKELWRVCWGRGFGLRHGIPLDLIIWLPGSGDRKDTWQALRGMNCEQGKLEMKLLGQKQIVDSHELVVWAKNKPELHSRIPSYGGGLRHRRY